MVRYVGFDSAPFTNGELHLGHARNYILGDVDARFQRLMGRTVAYSTNFDAFGLPTILSAQKAGCSPDQLARDSRKAMSVDMRRLGLSYDWSRVRGTSDPEYMKWTQRLFLLLMDAGLAVRKMALVEWCPDCQTTLAHMQVTEGTCERCGTPVERRERLQWVILLTAFSEELYAGIDDLTEWSPRGRNLMKGFMGRSVTSSGDVSFHIRDWTVSRQRSWGTPIPVLHCPRCGTVPAEQLPFEPTDSVVPCPACKAPAQPEEDRLDCYFDDSWFFLSWGEDLATKDPFLVDKGRSEPRQGASPVDTFHAGYDTFVYLHLYRFIARFLWKQGRMTTAEPIRRYIGHDVITRKGAKMSKSRGNSVAVRTLLDSDGTDVVRYSLIATAAPDKPIDWSPERLDVGRSAVARVQALMSESRFARGVSSGRISEWIERDITRAFDFYEQYRPHAAAQVLMTAVDWLRKSIRDNRLDENNARRMTARVVNALSPIIPFTASEIRTDPDPG